MIKNKVFAEEDIEQVNEFVKNNILKIVKIHKYIKNSKKYFKIYYKEK
ncbi:hypothetical protein HMPREF0514_10292 [Lactobacillus paragasseri JV-V03]|uniref:Uncharacterized protein n=1 Tax=Lactobacillus paragasseri JV-V03 TaxID=525326 RepID=A0AA87A3M0_9LACO|nr:hypothetical protein [Lactobacillus paragasseri]EFJ69848.1 hypothetical protein HMPREF0514_10292 [Lactobacillus paragasseri JV-V03]